MTLSTTEQEFCAGIAMGKTQAAAYREAFPGCAQWKDASIYTAACELAAKPTIRARVAELRTIAAEASATTLEGFVLRMEDLSRKAEAAGHFAAAIRAEELAAKARWGLPDRIELSGPRGGPLAVAGGLVHSMSAAEFTALARSIAESV